MSDMSNISSFKVNSGNLIIILTMSVIGHIEYDNNIDHVHNRNVHHVQFVNQFQDFYLLLRVFLVFIFGQAEDIFKSSWIKSKLKFYSKETTNQINDRCVV